MGMDASASICFGVILDNEEEMPWKDDDLEDWWRTVSGFVPKHPWPSTVKDFTERTKMVDAWFKEQQEWDTNHPLPFEIVYTGSGDWEESYHILAIKGTEQKASWDGPEPLKPLARFPNNAAQQLLDFCKLHEVPVTKAQPNWYLSAYYG